MAEYLPYIFGTSSLILGTYLFSLSFKFSFSGQKIEEERHKSAGIFMKICSILLLINGGYDLVAPNPDRYRIKKRYRVQWSQNEQDILVKNCLRDAKETTTKYPIIIKQYCECSMHEIVSNMIYSEYVECSKKSDSERLKIITPLIQDCINELNQSILLKKDKE